MARKTLQALDIVNRHLVVLCLRSGWDVMEFVRFALAALAAAVVVAAVVGNV